jgi:hypothetical protein
MDSQQLQQATSNPNIQRVLQKQVSLSKRLSTAGSSLDNNAAEGRVSLSAASARLKLPPETSFSHTETAV